MAERRVSVRLSVVGGNQTKAELAAVGADGQRSMERIAKATEPAGRGLRVVDAALCSSSAALRRVARDESRSRHRCLAAPRRR